MAVTKKTVAETPKKVVVTKKVGKSASAMPMKPAAMPKKMAKGKVC